LARKFAEKIQAGPLVPTGGAKMAVDDGAVGYKAIARGESFPAIYKIILEQNARQVTRRS